MSRDYQEVLTALREYREYYASWSSSEPLTLGSFRSTHGNMSLAIAFAALFWPEFVEKGGLILRAEAYSWKAYMTWLATKARDPEAVESVMNHVHVRDLFGWVVSDPKGPRSMTDGLDSEAELKAAVLLAHTLRRSWMCALQEAYPGVEFCVVVDEEDPGGPTVTFWRVRKRDTGRHL